MSYFQIQNSLIWLNEHVFYNEDKTDILVDLRCLTWSKLAKHFLPDIQGDMESTLHQFTSKWASQYLINKAGCFQTDITTGNIIRVMPVFFCPNLQNHQPLTILTSKIFQNSRIFLCENSEGIWLLYSINKNKQLTICSQFIADELKFVNYGCNLNKNTVIEYDCKFLANSLELCEDGREILTLLMLKCNIITEIKFLIDTVGNFTIMDDLSQIKSVEYQNVLMSIDNGIFENRLNERYVVDGIKDDMVYVFQGITQLNLDDVANRDHGDLKDLEMYLVNILAINTSLEKPIVNTTLRIHPIFISMTDHRQIMLFNFYSKGLICSQQTVTESRKQGLNLILLHVNSEQDHKIQTSSLVKIEREKVPLICNIKTFGKEVHIFYSGCYREIYQLQKQDKNSQWELILANVERISNDQLEKVTHFSWINFWQIYDYPIYVKKDKSQKVTKILNLLTLEEIKFEKDQQQSIQFTVGQVKWDLFSDYETCKQMKKNKQETGEKSKITFMQSVNCADVIGHGMLKTEKVGFVEFDVSSIFVD